MWRLTKSPLEHEVEELGEGSLALGLDVEDRVDDLVEDVVGELEAAGDLRVLEAVAEAAPPSSPGG